MPDWEAPDWEKKIRERLAPARLSPARETEIVEELAQHLDDCYQRLLAEGATPDEAYQSTMIELDEAGLSELKLRRTDGDSTGIAMEPGPSTSSPGKAAGMGMVLNDLWQDLRFALRGLKKQPGFAWLAILALSLGIGSATLGIGVVGNLLYDPFPYKSADRLVTLTVHDVKAPERERSRFLLPEFLEYQQKNHVLEDMIGSYNMRFVYSGPVSSESFLGSYVTPNTFEFFGVPPLLGRGITEEDGRPGAPPVFVMNYRLWQEEFGGDPKILNTTLTLNEEPRTLVGIMPPRFQAFGTRVWVPITMSPANVSETRPGLGPRPLWTIGRLKSGVNLQSAAAEFNVLGKQISKTYSKFYPPDFLLSVDTVNDFVLGNFKGMLYALMASVMMLLLIACSNVANLLLARATARDRELAIRASIGASRGRLVRQLMAESLVLSAAGLIGGCALAYLGMKVVVATIPRGKLPDEAVIGLNPAVLAVSIGVTLLVTFLCGLAPALHAIRGELPSRIASSGRMGDVFRHGKLRAALVIGEVALSLVLLTGAGLMVRSFLALRQVDLGFDPAQVGFAEVFPAKATSHNLDQQKLFFRQVLDRVQAIPGVTAAAETSSIPALFGGGRAEIDVPGITHSEQWGALMEFCSEDYFQTLGLQLLQGRMLTRNDVDSSAQVAVINHTLATRYFGHTDPVGKQLKFIGFDQIPDEPHSPYFEIIGVVSDFKNRELRLPSEPQAYVPFTISAIGNRAIIVRSVVKPESLTPDIRRAIWAVDSNVAVAESGSVEYWLNRISFGAPHFGSIFLGSFAAVGLALAGIGIFSVMAYTVSLQTHEVGVRMALGAQRGDVLLLVLFKGLRLIAAGVVTGLCASYALTRFLANQLWGVSANDPRIYGAVIVIMMAAGAAACLLPARKATQVDPIIAIRCE